MEPVPTQKAQFKILLSYVKLHILFDDTFQIRVKLWNFADYLFILANQAVNYLEGNLFTQCYSQILHQHEGGQKKRQEGALILVKQSATSLSPYIEDNLLF